MEGGSKIVFWLPDCVLNTNSLKKICEDSMPMTAGYNMYLQCIEQYGQITYISTSNARFLQFHLVRNQPHTTIPSELPVSRIASLIVPKQVPF